MRLTSRVEVLVAMIAPGLHSLPSFPTTSSLSAKSQTPLRSPDPSRRSHRDSCPIEAAPIAAPRPFDSAGLSRPAPHRSCRLLSALAPEPPPKCRSMRPESLRWRTPSICRSPSCRHRRHRRSGSPAYEHPRLDRVCAGLLARQRRRGGGRARRDCAKAWKMWPLRPLLRERFVSGGLQAGGNAGERRKEGALVRVGPEIGENGFRLRQIGWLEEAHSAERRVDIGGVPNDLTG